MTVGDRIRSARIAADVTQTALGNSCGCSKQTIYKYENNIITNIPLDKVKQIANYLCVSAAYLLGWENNSSSVPPGFQENPALARVPRVGRIACGEPITAEENIEDYDNVPQEWRSDFTLVCCGDSMLPKIQDGDVVAIRKQEEVRNGEVAAVRIGDEATLKYVFLHSDYIELRPANPAYESIIRRHDDMNDVRIEGKAVGLFRDLD